MRSYRRCHLLQSYERTTILKWCLCLERKLTPQSFQQRQRPLISVLSVAATGEVRDVRKYYTKFFSYCGGRVSQPKLSQHPQQRPRQRDERLMHSRRRFYRGRSWCEDRLNSAYDQQTDRQNHGQGSRNCAV